MTRKNFKAMKAILYCFVSKCRPFLFFLRFGGRTSSEKNGILNEEGKLKLGGQTSPSLYKNETVPYGIATS